MAKEKRTSRATAHPRTERLKKFEESGFNKVREAQGYVILKEEDGNEIKVIIIEGTSNRVDQLKGTYRQTIKKIYSEGFSEYKRKKTSTKTPVIPVRFPPAPGVRIEHFKGPSVKFIIGARKK